MDFPSAATGVVASVLSALCRSVAGTYIVGRNRTRSQEWSADHSSTVKASKPPCRAGRSWLLAKLSVRRGTDFQHYSASVAGQATGGFSECEDAIF